MKMCFKNYKVKDEQFKRRQQQKHFLCARKKRHVATDRPLFKFLHQKSLNLDKLTRSHAAWKEKCAHPYLQSVPVRLAVTPLQRH